MREAAGHKRLSRALQEIEQIADPLARLDAIRRALESPEALEADTVVEARKLGITWLDIGKVYGLTKQGAQQRFRRNRASTAAK